MTEADCSDPMIRVRRPPTAVAATKDGSGAPEVVVAGGAASRHIQPTRSRASVPDAGGVFGTSMR